MKPWAANILRRLYHRLLPPGAKSTLKVALLFDRSDKPPSLVTEFTARQVVVLAPHMDDETLGCGGTLRRHLDCGARVTVVYTTDGRRGDSSLYRQSLSPQQLEQAQRALAVRRREEAQAAAKVLGVQELLFLDGPDGSLASAPPIGKAMTEVLQRLKPEVVYLPSFMDVHPDHWATVCFFAAALAELNAAGGWSPIIRGYEVWTPLYANCLVDITEQHELKVQALAEFTSQIAAVDYARALSGLNAYRSIYQGRGRGYAEAFFQSTAGEFQALFVRMVHKP